MGGELKESLPASSRVSEQSDSQQQKKEEEQAEVQEEESRAHPKVCSCSCLDAADARTAHLNQVGVV